MKSSEAVAYLPKPAVLVQKYPTRLTPKKSVMAVMMMVALDSMSVRPFEGYGFLRKLKPCVADAFELLSDVVSIAWIPVRNRLLFSPQLSSAARHYGRGRSVEINRLWGHFHGFAPNALVGSVRQRS